MSLELKNVEKKVGIETHIYPTNIKLEKNTINVLLGSTLAGKTTLMQIMAGLDKPTSGEIWFNGKNVTGKQVQKRNVSMVYQQFINYPSFTVFENIASPLKITGVNSDEIKERVGKVAELLKLSGMLNKKPNELSGGQQQRLCIARSLAIKPEILLMDEPTSALDPKATAVIEELIAELRKSYTIIIVTHNMQQAARVSDYTAFLFEGELIEFGKTKLIFTNPENQQTENYITGRFG